MSAGYARALLEYLISLLNRYSATTGSDDVGLHIAPSESCDINQTKDHSAVLRWRSGCTANWS
jgi:hypothetical protein